MHSDETRPASEFWDELYGEREQVWSGKPNPALVSEIETVAPGRALDLGCGEGADALWLAQRGWTVTGVDISGVALERAARHAQEAGLEDRTVWLHRDLAEWQPDAEYDLVSAQFLHSPLEFPRERVLLTAARAVAPGGLLLVVGHADFPPWAQHAHEGERAQPPTANELALALGLPEDQWTVEARTSEGREATGPDGQKAILTDAILKARRTA
ncbi:SAM-dependent methyltransferase [Sinomonas sp. P47F7]|uniref:SAM-dependent methyltransferase n=1 Tax=Sinomonas sp. P47F7 TaxID=3410987 RepID=UPI003BF576B0